MRSLLSLISIVFMFSVSAANAGALDELLQQVKQSNQVEQTQDVQALNHFKNNLKVQQKKLQQAQDRNVALQKQMRQLQALIAKNNERLRKKQKLANEEKADLNQVFTEFQRASQDLRGQLKKTPISAALPGRSAALAPFSEADYEPTAADMKRLWLMFTEQMVATSKIVTGSQMITMPDGGKQTATVTRLAGFSAFTDSGVLVYQPDSESYQLLTDLPTKLQASVDAFSDPQDGFVGALIDPSDGGLLTRAAQSQPWWQSLLASGIVGGFIVILGIIGVGIGGYRLVALYRQGREIEQQKQQLELLSDNALGRILRVADQHQKSCADELARFLDEAILAELPEFRKGLGTLAVLAAVAPLLGLLGTVAGMIETFQAITAYGNSDPQVLSSGISQALLTTKFGLIAAVPLMLLHSFLSSRSDRLLHVIEHQSAGLLAMRQKVIKQGDALEEGQRIG